MFQASQHTDRNVLENICYYYLGTRDVFPLSFVTMKKLNSDAPNHLLCWLSRWLSNDVALLFVLLICFSTKCLKFHISVCLCFHTFGYKSVTSCDYLNTEYPLLSQTKWMSLWPLDVKKRTGRTQLFCQTWFFTENLRCSLNFNMTRTWYGWLVWDLFCETFFLSLEWFASLCLEKSKHKVRIFV